MVLNPREIELTFLKLDLLSLGFNSYYNLQCIELDKVEKNVRRKFKFCAYKKIDTLKNGSIPCWVQYHPDRFKIEGYLGFGKI